MATLFNTQISATYVGLIKTIDNAVLTATLKELTDGSGNQSGLYANTAGDFKVSSILEFGSLKDTGENIIITKFVDAADGILNNNNDTSIPTSKAVKDFVETHVTAQDLDFQGDTGTGSVDLDSQLFDIEGTTNEIITSASGQKLTIGLPNSVTISGTYTGATFAGELNGTISSSTTATTQSSGTSNTTVATTKFVMDLDSASDLDFSGDSGTGDVNLNTQVFAVTGTTNQIVTAASNQGLSFSLPATVHRNLQGNVTGNVTGDLTGNVTATSVLANGVSATTQSSSDDSTKVATTAFVKGLNNASDLDFTTDSGSGAVVLNSQTFSVLGTTNQINSAGSGQAITLSLPATVQRNLQGNVTGDLTGNADTATAWETARDLSLTGQATGTISSVNGTSNVSGAVTLDNNSVTAKVLTGLPTPAALTVFATDSILEGIGKLQSQINGIANGLQFQGTWDVPANNPVLASGGGEADSGTTTATTANKLIDSTQNFLTTVSVGDKVINRVDGQSATVDNVDSNTSLTLSADIMLINEAYTIDKSPFIEQGYYYVVSVGGTRTLNGISNWAVGDWVIAGATNVWEKLDHTDVEGTGTGTASTGNIARWSGPGTIVDSIMAEASSIITVSGSLTTTGNLSSAGDLSVNTNKFTANATSGNVAFTGDLAINTDKFTVNATSGNTLVAGTLGVGIAADSNLRIANNDGSSYRFGFAGTSDVYLDADTVFFRSDNGNVNNITFNSGAATFGGNVGVDLVLTVGNNLRVTGAGNANDPFLTPANDTNTGIYFPGSGKIGIGGTGGLEVENGGTFGGTLNSGAITSTGNIQLGGTTPTLNFNKTSSADILANIKVETDAGSGGKLTIQTKRNGNTSIDALVISDDQNSTFAGDVGLGGTGLYTTSHSLNIDGTGLAIKNNVSGSNNNWSHITNSATASTSNLVFTTGSGIALTLAHNTDATFPGSVEIRSGNKLILQRPNNGVATEISTDSTGAMILNSINDEGFFFNNSGTNAFKLDPINATFAGNVTCIGLDSQTVGAVAGYFASATSIDANQILHIRDNVATTSVNSAGGIKISSSPGNDVFLVKRNETTSSFFGLQNSSGTEFITVNMANGTATFAGTVTATDALIATGTYPGLSLTNPSNTRFALTNRHTDNRLSFDVTPQGGSTVEVMNLTSSGLGIGINTPSYKFHVFNNTDGFISRFTGGTSSDINIGVFASNSLGFGSIGTQSTHPFNIFTDGTDRIRIDQYGGVGINAVPEGNWINTTNVLQIGKGAAFWGTNNSNNAYISNNMFVNTNGNNHSLYAGGAAQYRQSDNIHLWYTSNVASAGNEVITLTERMRISSGGEVDITGTIKSGGNQRFGAGPAHGNSGSPGITTKANSTSGVYWDGTGAGGWGGGNFTTNNSDRNMKTNIVPMDIDALNVINSLETKYFNWTEKANRGDTSIRKAGIIAQDLKKLMPEGVYGTEWKDDDENTNGLSLDENATTALLIKAIQELKAEVDLLKQECKCK